MHCPSSLKFGTLMHYGHAEPALCLERRTGRAVLSGNASAMAAI